MESSAGSSVDSSAGSSVDSSAGSSVESSAGSSMTSSSETSTCSSIGSSFCSATTTSSITVSARTPAGIMVKAITHTSIMDTKRCNTFIDMGSSFLPISVYSETIVLLKHGIHSIKSVQFAVTNKGSSANCLTNTFTVSIS